MADSTPPNPTRPAEPGRDPSIDALRGFLILCVLAGHLPFGHFYGTQTAWWPVVNETIYLFHVPLFFAISCLFLPELAARRLLTSLAAIAVPYVLWYAWQRFSFLAQDPAGWTVLLLRGNFSSLGSTLWFLPALVSVRLLASLAKPLAGSLTGMVALSGLWLAGFALLDWTIGARASIPFGLDVAFYCLPYCALIVWVERRRESWPRVAPWAWWLLVAGLTLWVYAIEPLKTHTPWRHRIDLAQLSVPHELGQYAAWAALGAAWFLAFRRVTWRPLTLIGRHSFPIYLIHYEVFKWFMARPGQLPGGPGTVAVVVIFALGLFLPLGLSLAARRLWPGVRWLGL